MKYKKNDKVWCHAIVSFILPYHPVTCATIKMRILNVFKVLIMLRISEIKGNLYLVKTANGYYKLYTGDNLINLDKSIELYSQFKNNDPLEVALDNLGNMKAFRDGTYEKKSKSTRRMIRSVIEESFYK